jgi:phosphomannomutase
MANTIVSVSGIRGGFNEGLDPSDVARYAGNFASLDQRRSFLIGRDTRSTGNVMSRIICGTLLGKGADVLDYGVLSTPALFRESRRLKRPALIVTASHNEPDWNGIKFVIDGRGIVEAELERVAAPQRRQIETGTELRSGHETGVATAGPVPSYNSELISMVGEGSCDGVKVVIDTNGGAAIFHAPAILKGLGCALTVLGGTPGLFSRAVDPTADGLQMLSMTVREKQGDVGFAFDCDGDRLVLVDPEGTKRSGDYMLTLALKELLPSVPNRTVVVSVDTTQAVEDVVSELGGKVYRSKVGEANVVSMMTQTGSRFGGEGSSGGMIDGEFNYCRDSMLAAVTIASAVKKKGTKIFDRVRSYNQVRLKMAIERRKGAVAIKRLRKEYPEAEDIDGLKIPLTGRTWVLIRQSGTEDVVRISAESTSEKQAEEAASSFFDAIKRLGA